VIHFDVLIFSRALPWDTAIGEEALDLDAFVRHLVMKLLSNLQSKAKNYLNQTDDIANTVRSTSVNSEFRYQTDTLFTLSLYYIRPKLHCS